MADLSDAQFTQLFGGKCISFILKKSEMIMGKNEKLAMLVKYKNRPFPGHFLLPGSYVSDSLGAMHRPLCHDGASGTHW